MAQGRVTDYFSARKSKFTSQPSKRRKVEISSSNVDISSSNKANVNPFKNLDHPELESQIVDTRKENAFSPLQTRAARKSKTVTLKTPKSTTRSRKAKVDPKQKLLPDVLSKSSALAVDEQVTKVADVVTSSWDEHDGQASTPSKSGGTGENENITTKGRKRDRNVKVATVSKDEATPEKRQPETTSPQDSKARKKLLLKTFEKNEQKCEEDVIFNLPKTPPPISPLPPTPPVQPVNKNAQPKMSAAVMEAMERCKSLTAESKSKSKVSPEDLKEKLSKCGKLEELKTQLAKMKETKAKLKTPIPKLEQFDKITVEVEKESEPKPVPAYEKFHSLATQAPPSLTLPYKYKLLAETFRGMDTVVSMLHNRNEICTFSKLKTAVQSMNKKNFELKHVSQIKTVYPTAYELRQEKGLPMFGNKTSDYQLTVEAKLDEGLKKNQRPDFTASHLVSRRNNFHNKLIQIVKRHHKEFLANMSRPLPAPDNITRWHPKFPLDQVPDVEPSPLPQPPVVKTYHSARDVLEDTRGKLNPKIEKALEETAKELEKSQAKPPVKPVTSNTSQTNCAKYKGVPQALLDKIRAKEAANIAAELTRDPKEEKRTVMMKRLPDLIRIIRSHFITEKKPTLPLESVVQKLTDSYRSCIAPGDVEAHINLTMELVPEWMSSIQIKKGKYLKIDKNMDLTVITDKISNIVKGRK